MFHKYSTVANCLKACSQLESALPNGIQLTKKSLANKLKYSYEPITRIESSSAHTSAAHSDKPYYKRWQDVPDELIPKSSPRDPNNTIYTQPAYIKLRKQQIFIQQDDGIPIYRKFGLRDRFFLYLTVALAITGFTWAAKDIYVAFIRHPPKEK